MKLTPLTHRTTARHRPVATTDGAAKSGSSIAAGETPTEFAGTEFGGTVAQPVPRPVPKKDGSSSAIVALRTAEVARTKSGHSVAAIVTKLVPPRPDLVVLELGLAGAESAAAGYADARAQVTSFVEDASSAAALDKSGAIHHVEVRGDAALETLGINPERFDVVIAHRSEAHRSEAHRSEAHRSGAHRSGAHRSEAHRTPAGDLQRLAKSVAPGGVLVIEAGGNKKPSPALLAAAKAAGLTFTARERVADGEGWALVFTKPGKREPLPIDRTACSDRARVAKLVTSPVAQGPSSLAVVDDDDAALRTQLDAMKRALDEGVTHGDLDIANVPLPNRVARTATRFAPKADALVIFAHPDDESGYAAGAIAKLTSQGASVHYALATDGGGGLDAVGDGHDLAAKRLHELEGAASALGIGGVTVLGLADTGMYLDDHRAVPVTAADALAAWGVDAALEKIVRAIREQRPRVILGFDPTRDPDYGLHGHHLAIGVAIAVAVHLAADPKAFPEQGLQPFSVEEQWAVLPKGAAGGRQAVIDVDVEKKRQALESHRTQAGSLDGKLHELARTETWHLFQSRNDGPGRLGS